MSTSNTHTRRSTCAQVCWELPKAVLRQMEVTGCRYRRRRGTHELAKLKNQERRFDLQHSPGNAPATYLHICAQLNDREICWPKYQQFDSKNRMWKITAMFATKRTVFITTLNEFVKRFDPIQSSTIRTWFFFAGSHIVVSANRAEVWAAQLNEIRRVKW